MTARRLLALFLALVSLTLAACGEEVLDEKDLKARGMLQGRTPAPTAAPAAPTAVPPALENRPDPLVIEVGDGGIPWSTFVEYFRNRLKALGKEGKIVPAERKAELARAIMDELVTLELTWREARRRKLAATDHDVERYLEQQILPRMGGDRARLAARLKSRGHDLASFRETTRRNISSLRLMEAVASAAASRMTTAEVEAHWKAHQADYRLPPRLRFAHLVLNRPRSGDPAAVEEVRRKAAMLLERLRSGASFERVSRENSACLCRESGGVVPPLGNGPGQGRPHPPLPSVLRRALQALSPGEISPVIETPGGFEILHLRAREAARELPFPHVGHRVRADLARARTEELLQGILMRLRSELVVRLLHDPAELVRAFEQGKIPDAKHPESSPSSLLSSSP